MAGHNKWSKIKHKKGATDAKRSKVWTKIIREITVAVKLGGDDANSNPRLRKALEEARFSNIPKDTIARAQAKGNSTQDSESFEELVYEGYGPGGVAILVDCLTDNRNRTYSDVRTVFNKNGGNLGAPGSVGFGFKKKGQFVFEKKLNQELDEDTLLETGLDFGLEDVASEEEVFAVTCDFEQFFALKEVFDKAGLVGSSSGIVMIPDTEVDLTGKPAQSFLKLVDSLEEIDDVQNVWSNEDISDDEMQKFMS